MPKAKTKPKVVVKEIHTHAENTKATSGAGAGAAIATLVVMFGPQFGWFEIPDPVFAAAATGALSVALSAAARYLPAPKG